MEFEVQSNSNPGCIFMRALFDLPFQTCDEFLNNARGGFGPEACGGGHPINADVNIHLGGLRARMDHAGVVR